MKLFAQALFAAALVAPVAKADDIQVTRYAQPIDVDSVSVATVGQQGFPIAEVKVQATFGNACVVPTADELVKIVSYSDDYSTLNIALGNESRRLCTMEYSPVTVTIDLGQFVRPNDGFFSAIAVNGVQAPSL